jgi:integrase
MTVTPESLKRFLKTRRHRGRETFRLDLRRAMHLPPRLRTRSTLFEPGSSPHWPTQGRSTEDRATAEGWLTSYATWLNNELTLEAANGQQQGGPLFVADAALQYLKHLRETWEDDGYSTVVNRKSNIMVHIIPAFPSTLLSTLSTPSVQRFLDNVLVSDGNSGMKRPEPNTLQALRDTLTAIWRHHMKCDPPFLGTRLDNTAAKVARRKAILAGEFEGLQVKGSYVPDEITRLLVRAMLIDLQRPPNIAKPNTPYTALAMALQYGLAARVGELRLLRWKCLDRHERLILIPGPKNPNALRWTVVFDSVWPWIEEAERLACHATGEMDWLIRVDPRPGHEARQLACTTLQSRFNRVHDEEGLKIHGEATHILRDSWMTNVLAGGLDPVKAKTMAGHVAVGGATESYLNRHELLQQLLPSDRRLLPTLPTPEEVRRLAEEAIRAQAG